MKITKNGLNMKPLNAQTITASPIVREAMKRLLSTTARGFSKEEREALNDFEGPLQSGHASD